MINTTIVTAFFDIGRSSWDVGFRRTNSHYYSYFKNLCKLKNDIVVFTSEDLIPYIKENTNKTNITYVPIDFKSKWGTLIKTVSDIQSSDFFKSKISKSLLKFPEYSIPEYVVLTTRKVELVNSAIESGLVKTKHAAWVDFGYVRGIETLNNLEYYNSQWDNDKVHMFTHQNLEKVNHIDIQDAIFYGKVYLLGGSVIARSDIWQKLNEIYYKCFDNILKMGLADDDQGYFIASYVEQPDLFETHYIKDDWFPLFKFLL